jgi:ABC-type multidrug transport system fused ATPase/permease subunit
MFIVVELIDVFSIPIVWAEIMDVITRQGITPSSMKTLSILLGLVFTRTIVTWALHGPARLIECTNAFKVRANYRRFLTQGLLTLPLEWHADHHSGDTIDKSGKGTTALYETSEDSFEIIYCLVRLVGCYGMLVYFSHSSAYIVLVMMLVSVWITMRFDKILIKNYRELNLIENQISESIFDAVSNVSTVIILRVEKLVFDAIMHKVEKPFELFKQTNRLNETKWFLTSVCCTIMTVAVLGAYFWQHLGTGAGVLVGSVYLLISYLQKIGDLFFRFCSMYGDIMKRKTRVMNSEELTVDFRTESFANHVLPPQWKNLQIRGLNFSYHTEGADDLHLRDISLSIARGERIAFVGESGSGKTTLLQVIRNLQPARSFSLSVDGEIIPQGFEGIARAIALVPQNPEIFATTILSNITMGADYDMQFVRRFTDMACFTDVVESLPKQFDSSIKEKGVNLSGGQQQRLALSRGLLACHDKDVVLLDEPTSSLDASNEMRVYKNIFREFLGKTIISSIHRLHLLPLFDRICMFEDGKIIASGTLSELLTSCPQFEALWQQYTDHISE